MAIIYEADKGGYWAEVPAMPGCVTQAETKASLRRNLREAIAAWMDSVDHLIVLSARAKNAGKPTYSTNEIRVKLGLRVAPSS